MKETKVYVDESPKCIFCPMLVNLSNIGESEELMCCLNRTAYCNDYSDPEKIERNFKLACPLQSIKTHDREVVKEVCEKIRKKIESQTDVRIAVNNFNTITGHGLEYVFRRIQKEYEK